jgi:hypothetical protein
LPLRVGHANLLSRAWSGTLELDVAKAAVTQKTTLDRYFEVNLGRSGNHEKKGAGTTLTIETRRLSLAIEGHFKSNNLDK